MRIKCRNNISIYDIEIINPADNYSQQNLYLSQEFLIRSPNFIYLINFN